MNDNENRLKLLKRRDIDSLQEEFLKTKNESNLSVKLTKLKKENNEMKLQLHQSESNLHIPQEGNKKKKKDIISLDLNINAFKKSDTTNQQKQSIFKAALTSDTDTKINISTGLPNTFKVSKDIYEMSKVKQETGNNVCKIQTTGRNIKEDFMKKNLDLKIDEKNDYKEIHSQNLDFINKMSKEEILENLQEINAKIPKKLLEKMKNNLIQNKLSKEENKIHVIANENENNSEILQENSEEEEEEEIAAVKENVNTSTATTLLVNYSGHINEGIASIESESENQVDYSKLKFDEINLTNKFFSLSEIKNLIMSTSESHISIGLKLFQFLIKNNYLYDERVQKMNIIQNIFYFIDNKNLTIRIISIEIFNNILSKVFELEIETFKYNFYYCNNFPGVFLKQLNEDKIKSDFINIFQNEESHLKINIFIKNYIKMLIIKLTNEESYTLKVFKLFYYYLYLAKDFTNFKNSELEVKFKELLKLSDKLFSEFKSKDKLIKVFSDLLSLILLQLKPTELDEYVFIISNCSLLVNSSKINFILLMRTGRVCSNYETNKKKGIISLNITNKLISSEHEPIKPLDMTKYSKLEDLNNYELLRLSREILLCIKYSRYARQNETEFFIVENRKDILLLEELFEVLIGKLKNQNSLLCELSIFEVLNSIVKFAKFTRKYPSSIKYIPPFNTEVICKLSDLLEKYTKVYVNKLKVIYSGENKDSFDFLYVIENFTKLNLSFIKFMIKYSKHNLVNLLLNFPSLLNSNQESYYYKYLKYLEISFSRKMFNLDDFTKKINFSFEALMEDLNLYLGSNEDLRHSEILKEALDLAENPVSLLYTSNRKSKYLPFNNNFIVQILTNDKISSEVKLNYLVFLTVICKDELEVNLNLFEIILKTFVKFKDTIHHNKAEIIFDEYINSLVITNPSKITLEDNKDNEVYLQMYFNKFEFDNPNLNEIYYAYKFLPVIFLLVTNNCRLIKENLTTLIFTNFSLISDTLGTYTNSIIVEYFINNLSVRNQEFYEAFIVAYLKFTLNRTDSNSFNKNVLISLSESLILKLQLVENLEDDSLKELYNKLTSRTEEVNKEIRNKIYFKLI